MSDKSSSVPVWAWVIGVILVLGLIASIYQTVQVQGQLNAAQSELDGAMAAKQAAETEAAGMETQVADLKSQVEQASAMQGDMQAKLD